MVLSELPIGSLEWFYWKFSSIKENQSSRIPFINSAGCDLPAKKAK